MSRLRMKRRAELIRSDKDNVHSFRHQVRYRSSFLALSEHHVSEGASAAAALFLPTAMNGGGSAHTHITSRTGPQWLLIAGSRRSPVLQLQIRGCFSSAANTRARLLPRPPTAVTARRERVSCLGELPVNNDLHAMVLGCSRPSVSKWAGSKLNTYQIGQDRYTRKPLSHERECVCV